MFMDVAHLREFYTSTLGQQVRRLVVRQIRTLWPSVRGQSVMALGYATPFLRPFMDEAERTFAFMPAAQGVIAWPKEGANRTALVEVETLPLPDASVDRVILVHLVECAPHLDAVLDEVWRVLTSGGRLMVIAPNRSGLWAQSDATPFGHGVSFSARQLKTALRDHLFIPEQHTQALFMPPSQKAFWIKTAPLWERLGKRWCSALAGVHIVEASKQLYAPAGKATPPRVARVCRVSPALGKIESRLKASAVKDTLTLLRQK